MEKSKKSSKFRQSPEHEIKKFGVALRCALGLRWKNEGRARGVMDLRWRFFNKDDSEISI